MAQTNKTVEAIIVWMQERTARDLDKAPDEVDIDTPFDQLGLDSLAILTATGELAEWLEVELEAATLFEYATIRKMAEFLAKSSS